MYSYLVYRGESVKFFLSISLLDFKLKYLNNYLNKFNKLFFILILYNFKIKIKNFLANLIKYLLRYFSLKIKKKLLKMIFPFLLTHPNFYYLKVIFSFCEHQYVLNSYTNLPCDRNKR